MNQHNSVTTEDDDFDNAPSRSQVKREMEALQDLGEELILLSVDTLKKFDLPEQLLTALLDAKKITSNGAIRRQRQYIGKLMRSIDPEPILAQINILKGENDAHTAWLHRLERWRDRLIKDDSALADLMDDYTVDDVQTLRQAVRNARREQAEGKPPKAYRQIFQILKTVIAGPGAVAASSEEGEDE